MLLYHHHHHHVRVVHIGLPAIPGVLQVENNYDVTVNNGPLTRVLSTHYPCSWSVSEMAPVFTDHVDGRPEVSTARQHGQRVPSNVTVKSYWKKLTLCVVFFVFRFTRTFTLFHHDAADVRPTLPRFRLRKLRIVYLQASQSAVASAGPYANHLHLTPDT